VLRGGAEKVIEAGADLAGGHSIDDKEPKYGLAVTGVARPDEIVYNAGARPATARAHQAPRHRRARQRAQTASSARTR
jgi:selenophosphate synthase